MAGNSLKGWYIDRGRVTANPEGRPEEVGYPQEWLQKEVEKNPKKFRIKSERQGEGEL